MDSHFLEKIGFISNQISRDKLKPGDHIYSWRNAYIYSHHGIYIGDEKVIHFTCGGGLETGTGTFLDKIVVSVIPNHKGDNPCSNCEEQLNLEGVISSCLDCFLAGGNIYLFEYSVSPAAFIAKPRRGTCTIAPSDPCDEVISRAKYLLLRNGFGDYHALENNCEDFAIYCKTSLLVGKDYVLGRGGQASSVSAAAWLAQLSPFGSKAIQLFADIGMRKDAIKVPVESLVPRAYATGTSRNRR
ncbi:putative LRAT-like domain-containing protein [Arabidopsis thaliana]|jgi:hypothetical protein|uniref:Gb/AAF32477.1 n=3 Tax=Arabidopsis TaxID=3701 RepID=Q9FFF0_ARATH|nr:NC domain-containing protein-like protein [Arabidopsis thaliana]KAG7602452.1 LRAT-like domain [Arabidopsis thaliana x Arabidopsis arenosa]AED92280.1 NC domain-containing protein-like protein [Arabidopsis thaliana]OAO93198.1 hypothetical protein AXX17_AT5G15930 [Arabidopsis thaliana]CAA0402965.1 unnamed protein product [Arabidopsis thaliana]CAD5331851.1 unnamed protein product [Arabidopsis thaliana]|eukprot:NP_197137.1 NC domain-containing protein-like protein [Arabidopsis thaliana]